MRHKIRLALLALPLALPSCTPPAATCNFTAAAVLPVTYMSGHRPVVTITIAGQPVRMMVDSDAGCSDLTSAAYDRLNLIGTRDFDITSTGISGDMQTHKAILEDIMIGQTKVYNVVLVLENTGDNGTPGHPEVDGRIGEDVLEPLNVAYDLPSNQIMLFKKPSCGQNQVPMPGDYAALPFTQDETGAPLLSYEINGQTIGAALDSGDSVTIIQQSDLLQAGIKPEAVSARGNLGVMGINGKTLPVKAEQFSTVTVGAETYSNPWLLVGDTRASIKIPSVIGDDYLSSHRVYIDNASHIAYIGLTVPGS